MQQLPSGAVMVLGVLIACGLLISGVAVWLGGDTVAETTTTDRSDATDRTIAAPLSAEELAAYQVAITNPMNPIAVIATNKGTIEIELFADTMPITAGNFVKLAEEGFYNGTKFHRVIDGFMIQGGDPNTKTDDVMNYGRGGPGYAIPDEHVKGEYLTNIRGTIAMANSGPQSGGSQFFINLVDNTGLDWDKEPLTSKHPVFGRVIEGMDVVDAIGQVETNPVDMPLESVVVESVTIRRGS